MSNRNTRYTAGQTGRKRPLSWWQTVHPGLRAAFITFWGIVLFFGCSGAILPRILEGWNAVIFYGMQFAIYAGNGFLAGVQADDSRESATRTVGYAGERAKRPRPSYIFNGLIAGVVLGLVLVALELILIAIATQNGGLASVIVSRFTASDVMNLLIILALATLGGVIGGFIYDRVH